MRKVCHVTSIHPALDDRIFHKECRTLTQAYDVTLIAPNTESRDVEGVHIVGVELPESRMKRPLYLHRVYEAMVKVDAEVYHFHDPELIRLGRKMQRRGKKVVFDAHEDVPQQILLKLWIPRLLRKPLSAYWQRHERRNFRHYDALVSVTPTIVERLRTYNSNTYQITNYPIFVAHEDQRQWGKSVCFAGGISPRYLNEVVLDALEGTDIRYRMAGPIEEGYEAQIKAHSGWPMVDYVGTLPYDQVGAFIQQSTVGIATLDYIPNVGYRKGSLGVIKFFEYLAAGIPVVATDFEVWKPVVEKYRCGFCVDPHDKKAVGDAIRYLIDHPEEARKMGDRGIEAVQKEYCWDTQGEILLKMYEELGRG